MGIEASFSNNILSGTYRTIITIPSALGAGFDSGDIPGFEPSGYVRCEMTGEQFTVDSACNWNLSFTSLTFYQKLGSAAETTLYAIGVGAMSGGGYDERLNITKIFPSLVGVDAFGGPPPCYGAGSYPGASSTSWTASASTLGGDEQQVGGIWTEDTCQVDTTLTPGACTCFASIDALGGGSSYSMTDEATITANYTVGSLYSVNCPGCIPNTAQRYDISYSFALTQSNLSVQSETTTIIGQTLTTRWTCNDNGTITSGGNGGVTTTPGTTTCASDRTVQVSTGSTIGCGVHPIPACAFPNTCPPGSTSFCEFNAEVSLTWPTFPPCGSASTALAYDVSSYLRHGSLWADSGTGHLILGFASNNNPRSITPVDTGITGTRGWIAWQDHQPTSLDGMLYVDGSGHLILAQTPDEGITFPSPVTISTTLVANGGFGYVEDANFVRHFWQQTGAGPCTIQYKVLDAQFNVVLNWANTNITNADKGPVFGRRTRATGGQMVLSLLYLVGGHLTFATSSGDGTFGTPVTISTTLVAGGGFTFWEDANLIRHFFQQIGSGPCTIQYAAYDSQMNVVVPWTSTNITNADLGSIACGRATASGGQLTLQLFYTVGGVVTLMVANGDETYS